MGVRRKYIRDLAEKLLKKHFPKGVPVDPAKIAEDLGIELRLEKVDDGLSGFLVRDQKNDRVVIGANLRHHPNRRKFTIAHELGHYLLHEAATVHLDQRKPGFIVQRRDGKSSTGEDVFEREANLFAAELLMPAKALAKDLRDQAFDLLEDDDEAFMKSLAEKYGVSFKALTIRLGYLGYISQ
ncbi:MAG: ImmA/IrrE family metallo-endopeptidase [Burkholderiales bacterium]